MDEFDIYLESTGSMETYQENTMASFRNMLSEPLQLDGDWRVALAEITFPSSIKNVTTKDYFVYTPRTASEILMSVAGSGGAVVHRPDWSSNATFPDGEIKSVENILEILKEGTVFNKPLLATNYQDRTVELEFADGYGISVQDRSLFNVLGFTGIPDPNRGGYFIGSNDKVRKQTQPVKGDFPADILTGTETFFVNCNIIEQQHIAGAKAPVLRVIDTGRKLEDGKLHITSSTTHKTFKELQFKRLVLNSIREIFVELVAATGSYVPFVGTGRVILTLKFKKF